MAEEVLNFDPVRAWTEHPMRACAELTIKEVDDLFFAGPSCLTREVSPAAQAAWDHAKEICAHCPVLEACHASTLGEPHGVWGGRDPIERQRARDRLTRRIPKWSDAFRAQVAEQVYLLRHETREPRDFQEIKVITGINAGALSRLYAEEEARRKGGVEGTEAPQEGEEVEGLTLPELPETPGKRHLWVIHMGVVRDAYYKAHSQDGTHVKVELRDVKAMTRVWLPLDRVRFYTDPERVTERMRGRDRYGIPGKRDAGYIEAA